MKNNNIIMVALVAVIAVMGIAFAAFSTTLNINGTATISSEWKITMAQGTCTNTTQKDSGKASTGTVTVSGTTATVTANMASPGDVLTCTVIVKNEGTLAAHRTSWSVTNAPATDDAYTVAVTPVTSAGAPGATLVAKNGDTVAQETLTMTITYKASTTTKPTAAVTFKAVATYEQVLA